MGRWSDSGAVWTGDTDVDHLVGSWSLILGSDGRLENCRDPLDRDAVDQRGDDAVHHSFPGPGHRSP